MRKRSPGTATLGSAPLTFSGGGARVASAVTIDSPLYKAGIDRDDLIVSIAGTTVTTQDALNQVLGQQQAGAKVPIRFVRRSGETVNGTIVLDEDAAHRDRADRTSRRHAHRRAETLSRRLARVETVARARRERRTKNEGRRTKTENERRRTKNANGTNGERRTTSVE